MTDLEQMVRDWIHYAGLAETEAAERAILAVKMIELNKDPATKKAAAKLALDELMALKT